MTTRMRMDFKLSDYKGGTLIGLIGLIYADFFFRF
jgi:hypothetical protein